MIWIDWDEATAQLQWESHVTPIRPHGERTKASPKSEVGWTGNSIYVREWPSRLGIKVAGYLSVGNHIVDRFSVPPDNWPYGVMRWNKKVFSWKKRSNPKPWNRHININSTRSDDKHDARPLDITINQNTVCALRNKTVDEPSRVPVFFVLVLPRQRRKTRQQLLRFLFNRPPVGRQGRCRENHPIGRPREPRPRPPIEPTRTLLFCFYFFPRHAKRNNNKKLTHESSAEVINKWNDPLRAVHHEPIQHEWYLGVCSNQ